ncbi:dihydrofolate reductase family protein [Nakamurella lactea]|uniref:dihydrofolate reductase family protein n=1 Tax=Nakamurella lactea TaxID=459515 RepID=UPI000411C6E2|nr:dihydrofolate reductase family protein [Nakamurella lactea]
MSKTVLYMSMSLDGFITGPNDSPDNGLGDDGHRLHEWFLIDQDGDPRAVERLSGPNREVMDQVMSAGAVVVGRRTFEAAGGWGGDHHDGVPVFVLSRRAPDPALQWPGVSYLSDVGQAMQTAKNAAGGRDVLVHGARTAQLAMAAGVLDEIQVHLIPVLLGAGRRLFGGPPADQQELELLRADPAPGVLHLRYRIRKQG